MILVRLETSDGRFVAEVEVPPFTTPPDVLIWGNRTFIYESNRPPQPVYRECFAVVVPIYDGKGER